MQRADPSKIAAVRNYCAHKFSGWSLQDHHEEETDLEVFTIEGGPTTQTFTLKIARGFLESHAPQQIEQILEQWQVGDFLKVSGLWPILVTSNGLRSMR